MSKKYYKTEFKVIVLSEEPIAENMELKDLDYEVTDGQEVWEIQK